jgi:hypothetical protein
MAVCGEPAEFEVTKWVWCWTWHGPWRCKKTEVKTLYVYDFAVLRKSGAVFGANYRACCEFSGGEFRWSEFSFWPYQGTSQEYNVTRRFGHQLSPIGTCGLGQLAVELVGEHPRAVPPETTSEATDRSRTV